MHTLTLLYADLYHTSIYDGCGCHVFGSRTGTKQSIMKQMKHASLEPLH